MRDRWGNEITMEQALALKREDAQLNGAGKGGRTSRRDLVQLRMMNWRHPHHGLPLRDPLGERCGTCVHCSRRSNGDTKRWIKCTIFGAAGHESTDIRASWPACERWVAEVPEVEKAEHARLSALQEQANG